MKSIQKCLTYIYIVADRRCTVFKQRLNAQNSSQYKNNLYHVHVQNTNLLSGEILMPFGKSKPDSMTVTPFGPK